MKIRRFFRHLERAALLALPLSLPLMQTAIAQTDPDTAPPASISPSDVDRSSGLAGDDPADIGRYLLASGASAAAISPDGKFVALLWAITGTPQIWLVPAEGGAPRQLTYGRGVTFFAWSPDGTKLIYGSDQDGDEREAYYTITRDGREERRVLPATESGFRSFGDVTADGRTLVYASTERNGLDFDIYRADLGTGEAERVFEGTFGFFPRGVSPDGRYAVVAETVGEDADILHLLNLDTGALQTLSDPEPRANHTDGGIAWRPDGSGFYFATNRDREFKDVHFYDRQTGETRQVADPDRDAGHLTLCGTAGRYLTFTENVDGFHTLHVLDLDAGTALTPPDLPEGVYGLSCAKDTPRLAVRINGWRTPGDVVVWDLAEDTHTVAFESHYAGIDPDRLIRPESVRFTARDGVELQGLLYLPDAASRKSEPPPVVFEVHGGPTAQSEAVFDPVIQYRLDRGLAVFEPNVRGSTGFGRTYTTLDDRERRRDSVRDLIDMLDALRADGRVDADRAAVSGQSYGGYMVNAVLALHPDAFKAGVSRYGVADWVTALQIASPALKASDRIEYGDIREPKWLEFYTRNSPIRMADRIRVPVLYAHGEMDPRIDIAETETMVRALRANGVEAPFIRIPDEGHGWRKRDNRLFYFRAEADFLSRQLAPADPAETGD